MQIQRIQTLFLLVAGIIMGFFCASSIGTIQAEDAVNIVMVNDFPVLLTVSIATSALLLINIFLFNNLRLQKRVTLVSMLLIATLAVSALFIVYSAIEGAQIIWIGGILLLAGALVAALLAYRGMTRDEKKLRDSDRIR